MIKIKNQALIYFKYVVNWKSNSLGVNDNFGHGEVCEIVIKRLKQCKLKYDVKI